jgi:hypothetical protein
MNTPAMLWTGRVLTGIFALFILGASVAPKLLQLPIAEETMTQLGWPPGYVLMIGLIELTCLVLYLIPRTSVLGAVLMMGLLGGAMATQIRVGNPLFSHILFSIYLGLFMWGGLWLRDPRLRALFPFARETARPIIVTTAAIARAPWQLRAPVPMPGRQRQALASSTASAR